MEDDPHSWPAGEKDPATIYVEIGEALTSFEEFEFLLAALFAYAVGAEDACAAAVWRSVNSLDTRLRMLGAACEAARAAGREMGTKLDQTAALKAVRRAADIRAKLAHGVVINTTPGNGPEQRFLFSPSLSMKTEGRPRGKDLLNQQGIVNLKKQYESEAKILRDFCLPLFRARAHRMLRDAAAKKSGSETGKPKTGLRRS